MALKPDRKVTSISTDVHWHMNEVAERGIIVAHNTAGSGAAMDDANAVVQIPTSTGDVPAGMLMNDVVNLDLTRTHINWHQDQVQLGGKVTVMTHGWAVTDQISGTPSAGNDAYFVAGGLLTSVNSGSQRVGKFLSVLDVDGYAKVDVRVPG